VGTFSFWIGRAIIPPLRESYLRRTAMTISKPVKKKEPVTVEMLEVRMPRAQVLFQIFGWLLHVYSHSPDS